MSAPAPRPRSGFIDRLRGSAWLTSRIGYMISLLMIFAGAAAYGRWLMGTSGGLDPTSMKPVAADFTSFWVAARTVIEGVPATAYDLQRHTQAQLAALPYPPGASVPIVTWSYPPLFLAMVSPFGLLPLGWAFAAWIVLTTAFFVEVVRRIAPNARFWLPQLAALGFSGTQDNLHYGQNGALTAAMLGLGLWWLPKRPLAAGMCFAVLTCKPQLFLLLPVALLAGRYYRAFWAALTFTLFLLGLSLLAFGANSWVAFFGTVEWSRNALLDQGDVVWGRMPSLFAALRLAGLPLSVAYAGQGLVTVLAAALLWVIWRSRAAYEIKAAAVVFATVCATPYLLTYDLMLLGIGIVWLVREGVLRGFPPWSPLLIALAWYSATISDFAAPLGLPFVTLLCLATLGVLRRA